MDRCARWTGLGVGLALALGLAAAPMLSGCGDDGSATTAETGESGSSSGSGSTQSPLDSSGTSDPTGTAGTAGTTTGPGESSESTAADPCAMSPDPGPAVAWASYGLDARNSRHNALEAALTPSTLDCLQPRWSVSGLDGVTSTPAVVDGVVYVGDWAGALRAYDLADGRERWVAEVDAQVNDSPLVTDDAVYFADGGGWLHAVARADGAPLWSVELDAHEYANIFSSPVLAGDRLVIGVASIELATVQRDYTFRGAVVALDPATGDELWRFYTTTDDAEAGAGVSVWSSAAYDEARGLVYIGSGNTYEAPASSLSDALLAIDVLDGSLRWSRQFTEDDVYTIFGEPPQGPDADVGASPNLFMAGDREVVGVGDKAGVYSVLDRDDGETVWAVMLTPGAHLGGVMTTAAVDDDTIYVASNTWTDELDWGDPRNTASIFALDAETGDVRWEQPVAHPVFGALTVAGGLVYHGGIEGTVHVRAAEDGTELWTDQPGGDIGGGFAVAGGHLVVGHGFWFFAEPAQPSGGLVVYGLGAGG
ncbi:MAG: PQQ-binding-like beta-propeller repeat protein [Myxococcales bacterium]|nr:PQQ-binding-like beta-propeller repeat protein [Myxococcales bacterium]